jgi:hypothetical protein
MDHLPDNQGVDCELAGKQFTEQQKEANKSQKQKKRGRVLRGERVDIHHGSDILGNDTNMRRTRFNKNKIFKFLHHSGQIKLLLFFCCSKIFVGRVGK